IHGISGNVEHPTHDTLAHRHAYRFARVANLETALQAFGAGHGNCPDPPVPEVLLDFKLDRDWLVLNFVLASECVIDRRQSALKFDINDRAEDFNYPASVCNPGGLKSLIQHNLFLTPPVRRRFPATLS